MNQFKENEICLHKDLNGNIICCKVLTYYEDKKVYSIKYRETDLDGITIDWIKETSSERLIKLPA